MAHTAKIKQALRTDIRSGYNNAGVSPVLPKKALPPKGNAYIKTDTRPFLDRAIKSVVKVMIRVKPGVFVQGQNAYNYK